jgi:phospholipid-translocating P-type ATPase (flippase)
MSSAASASAVADAQQPRLRRLRRVVIFPGPADGSARSRAVLDGVPVHANNTVRTTRYTLLSFLPLSLFKQFRRLTYVFFLFIAILQQVPTLAPTNRLSTIVPLVTVLLCAIFKDAIEEYSRHLCDLRANLAPVQVLRAGSAWEPVSSRDIVVGDIVRLANGDSVPADILLLSAESHVDQAAYVDMSQLDGDVCLKERRALLKVSGAHGDCPLTLSALLSGTQMEYSLPAADFLSFSASISLPGPATVRGSHRGDGAGWEWRGAGDGEAILAGPEHLLLRGMVLRNTRWAAGVVIYAGVDSTMSQNDFSAPPIKVSRFEKSVDRVIQLLICTLVAVCVACAVGAGIFANTWGDILFDLWYLPFLRSGPEYEAPIKSAFFSGVASVLLFNNLIPISLVITVEATKYLQARAIIADPHLVTIDAAGESVRPQVLNVSLNESLGLVDCVVTDKTGTLTENNMALRALSIAGVVYMNDSEKPSAAGWMASELPGLITVATKERFNAADALLCIALCNDVVALNDHSGRLDYHSTSPDEVALVRGISQLGLLVLERQCANFVRMTFAGHILEVEVIATYGFTNERRRMSVIVRFASGRFVIFSKGADLSMVKRMRNIGSNGLPPKGSPEEKELVNLDSFACGGLRTLVLAAREITASEAQTLLKLRAEAGNEIDEELRRFAVEKASDAAECGLELLGVSAVEDRLAQSVPATIATLDKAGILIAVCTGDKIETTVSVAIAAKIMPTESDVVILRSSDRDMNLIILSGARLSLKERKLWKAGEVNRNLTLVIDGLALDSILEAIEDERACDGKATKSASALTPSRPEQTGVLNPLSFSWSHQATALAHRIEATGVSFIEAVLPGEREISGATGVLLSKSTRSGDDRANGIRAAMAAVTAAAISVDEGNLRRDFCDFIKQSRALLFCRVTPLQKSKIVRLLQSSHDDAARVVLAVGDGANDAGMLQAADIGVGVIGVDGKHAATVADVAVGSFSCISTLILVHGRASFRRISLCVMYCMYKNALLVFILLCYSSFTGCSGSTIFESYAYSLWNILFTS